MPRRRSEQEPSPSPTPSDAESEDAAPTSSLDQMVKKLVRVALAHEYARQPLRRSDIAAKVLNGSRSFRAVFEGAQKILQDTFGMSLTELPVKDKVTVSQKRAAQRAQGSTSSKAYILTSTLPRQLRAPEILVPPRVPSYSAEGGYVGLTTFVVGLIYLSSGQRISESKLERHLKRCNADTYLLGEKTEKMLKRMEKESYIVKAREREAGGEETVDWVVGPRGKVEIGERGVASLVKGVYGKRDLEMDELEDRLEKSLGAGTFKRRKRAEPEAEGEVENGEQAEDEEAEEGSEAEAEDAEQEEEAGESE